MEVKDLKFDKRNYRRHNEKNQLLIKKSINDVGFGRSVVIDADNEIICGNGVISQIAKATPLKVIETDGTELVVVKRTDLKTDDERRKQLAVMDNSTSDTSDFDLTLLQEDFDEQQLGEWGLPFQYEGAEDFDEEDLMDNDNLPEMQTNKMLALSKMPLNTYIVIHFDDEMPKDEWIERFVKKYNPDTDITEKTQFCSWEFYAKNLSE